MNLPSLRSVIAEHQLFTRKSLGQHFLLDEHLLHTIAQQAGDLGGVHVLEIGPGPGGLTRALLTSGAASVHAIEKDDRCIAALEALKAHARVPLHLHHTDALETDLTALAPMPRAVVANLPYNIATPLLLRWLEDIYRDASAYRSLVLMFQKEVAERLYAAPGGKEYGRLSVMAQYLCDVRHAFDIPPDAFLPPPKVTSSVVVLAPLAHPRLQVEKPVLERVLAAAFGQRRKMLRSALKPLGVDTAALLERAGLDSTLRAEQVDIHGFGRLAAAYCHLRSRGGAAG